MSKINKILELNWGFYISRNIPVWHNSLQMEYGLPGYRHYKLPKPYWHFRVHHGVDADMYYSLDAKNGVDVLKKPLASHLRKTSYLQFLNREYKKDCEKFIKESLKLKNSFVSIKKFLRYYGYCTALLDITSWASKILTDKIMAELKDAPDKDEIIAYYSTPKKLTPIQQLEKAAEKLRGKNNLAVNAKKLYKKYRFIPVSFVGEPWDENYFIDLLKMPCAAKTVKPIIPQGKIPAAVKHDLRALSEITFLNEYRKAIFSRVSLNIRPVWDEIARQNDLTGWKDVSLLTHNEILDLIKGKNLSAIVRKRKNEPFAVYRTTETHCQIIYQAEVKKFENKFKIKTDGIKEFRGITGNKGVARGMVKIVFGPQDFAKFKSGDILVAKMTSVDYLPIMKKAGAFVTDEGGLACHAAVISREFGLPCIIGTKIATAVLQDGDMVEVDADNGVVRKV